MRNLMCFLALSAAPWALGCISINIAGTKDDGTGSVTVGAGGSGSGGAESSPASTSEASSTSSSASTSDASSSASGTGGGAPINVYDACPGGLISIPVGTALTVAGTTLGARDDYKTFCADPDSTTSAPDVVYQLGLPDDCTLSVTVEGQGDFQPAFSFRPTCGSDAGACIDTTVNGSTMTTASSAGYYSLVIDGVHQTSGDFNLRVKCDAPVCGDGIVNLATEQCDSGPGATPGDGCGDPGDSDACQVQQTVAADTCAQVVPVSVAPGAIQFPANPPPYNTIGSQDNYHSIDPSCTPAPAVDQVFGFIPTQSGSLTITVGHEQDGVTASCNTDSAGCWNHTLYLREGACETGTELTCSYPTFDGDDGVNSVTATVTAGTTYYLFVDGSDMTVYDAGPYYLQVSLQ